MDCPLDNMVNLRGKLRHNESMAKHTSLRVGGAAQWFYEPLDRFDLAQLLQQLAISVPIFWLGLGSNLLVRDGGINGIVILTVGLNKIRILANETYLINVETGVSCAKLARFAARARLTGTEFLAGIPGSFGGALAMNAGAWGFETWKLVQSVETLDRQGQFHRHDKADYKTGYRHVKGPKNEWFINAVLQLSEKLRAKSEKELKEGNAEIQTLIQKRNESQPIGLPTCGSVFRNPPGDYAARLIEQAGWKGRCVGGACVSDKHANFIVNHNCATAANIENLIEQIKLSVKQNFGVDLIPEVVVVGNRANSDKINI
jgi:UDP-N-acetylmuramate dehydrogenase